MLLFLLKAIAPKKKGAGNAAEISLCELIGSEMSWANI